MFIPRKDGRVNTDDSAGKITVFPGGCYTIFVQRSLNFNQNEDGVSIYIVLHNIYVILSTTFFLYVSACDDNGSDSV